MWHVANTNRLNKKSYHITQNVDGGNFDGYGLFKYLTENILMDGYHGPVMPKKFYGLNF